MFTMPVYKQGDRVEHVYLCIVRYTSVHITTHASRQTQNICIIFVQRRPNVFDVGPKLYKCYKKYFVIAGVDALSLI